MLIRLALLASLVLAGCQGPTAATDPETTPRDHLRSPTLRVQGEGAALHAIETRLSLAEVHEALGRAALHPVDEGEGGAGLTVLKGDNVVLDPIVRAIGEDKLHVPTWLGIPVRWNRVAESKAGALDVRAWPVLTELGPRGVVEIRLGHRGRERLRLEHVLVPGEMLALAADAQAEGAGSPETPAAETMGWGGPRDRPPIGVVLVIPCFDR